MNTFTEATEAYLKGLGDLGDDVSPLVTTLKQTAKALDDGGVNAALVNQYRLTYLAIKDSTNSEEAEVDPLEALLKR